MYLRHAFCILATVCTGCTTGDSALQHGGSSSTAATASTGAQAPGAPAVAPLSANDVSWLFPPPVHPGDLDKLIAVADLTAPSPQDSTRRDPVWPAAVFQQFLAVAASPAAHVDGTTNQIGLPPEAQSIKNWFVAGIRIDAGAPGLSDDVRAQFGQAPEIRLIIQPVARDADGTPHPFDIAGHLIFDFLTGVDAPAQPGCFPRLQPDLATLRTIAGELAALRTKLGNGDLGGTKVATAGVPLGVHPGLANAATAAALRQEMKAFLERHISADRLNSMAIMGLPSGARAPWMFLAMQNLHPGQVAALPNGGVVPVHGPTLDGTQFAQMLAPANASPRVVPTPHTNNLNPITCQHAALAAPQSVAERSGSSTSEVFAGSTAPDKTKDILDRIADPTRSHFFNTDCVSCHTETRRAMELLNVTTVAGIDSNVLPNGPWNVRNFGWSPPSEGPLRGTVTRRTAAETSAVLAFINAQLLNK